MFHDGRSYLTKIIQGPGTELIRHDELKKLVLRRDAYELNFWTLVWSCDPSIFKFLKMVCVSYDKTWGKFKQNTLSAKRALVKDENRAVQKLLVEYIKELNITNPKNNSWRRLVLQAWRVLESSRHDIAKHNLRIVLSVAGRYQHRVKSTTVQDLFNEGYIGLLKAVERYSLKRGTKFSTYAIWWVRHSIRRAIDDIDPMIRIPVHQADLHNHFLRTQAKMLTLTGKSPDPADVLREMTAAKKVKDVDKQLATFMKSFVSVVSINAPRRNDDDRTLEDTVPDEKETQDAAVLGDERLNEVRKHVERLPAKLREIIKRRFGFNSDEETLQEIASSPSFGLTRERIRQLEEKALRLLKKSLGRSLGDEFGMSEASDRLAS